MNEKFPLRIRCERYPSDKLRAPPTLYVIGRLSTIDYEQYVSFLTMISYYDQSVSQSVSQSIAYLWKSTIQIQSLR